MLKLWESKSVEHSFQPDIADKSQSRLSENYADAFSGRRKSGDSLEKNYWIKKQNSS